MTTLTRLTHLTDVTRTLPGSDRWQDTPAIEYLVSDGHGGWVPFQVLSPAGASWQNYEVQAA